MTCCAMLEMMSQIVEGKFVDRFWNPPKIGKKKLEEYRCSGWPVSMQLFEIYASQTQLYSFPIIPLLQFPKQYRNVL